MPKNTNVDSINTPQNLISKGRELLDSGLDGAEVRKKLRRGSPEPVVDASRISTQRNPISVPEPRQDTVPDRIRTVSENVLGDIKSRSESAKSLQESNALLNDFSNAETGADIQRRSLEQFGVTPESLSRLEEIQLQLAKSRGGSERQKEIIASGGQGAIQGGRSITLEDRIEAVRSATLASEAAVLSNNIQLGRELARDAVTVALGDRDFRYNNLLRQNTNLSKQVDEETSQLLLAENRKYEEKIKETDSIKKTIEDAVVSGAATSDEMAQLTAVLPDHPDTATKDRLQEEALVRKQALAQSIISRGNAELRADKLGAGRGSGLAYRKDLIELAKMGDPQAIQELGFDPSEFGGQNTDVIAYAQQYASTGKIPTGLKDAGINFGLIANTAKALPKQQGEVLSARTGVKDGDIPAAEQDDISRLYNITQRIERLKELDKERIGGLLGGTLGKVFGSDAQNEYLTVRKGIVDEIARMQTGAALTVDEQEFYKEYIPGRLSETFFLGKESGKTIENFETEMSTKLNNALANKGLVISGYSSIDMDGTPVKVGAVIENEFGQKGRVNADGSITLIE